MHIYGIWNNGTDEPVCRAGLEMQMQRMDSGTQHRKEGMSRENSLATCELVGASAQELVGSFRTA